MQPMPALPFLRLPPLAVLGRIQLGGQTRPVAGSVNHTGIWYEAARRDGGLMLLLVDATGPDAFTTEVVIEILHNALAGGYENNLYNCPNPGIFLDYLRQFLGA